MGERRREGEFDAGKIGILVGQTWGRKKDHQEAECEPIGN